MISTWTTWFCFCASLTNVFGGNFPQVKIDDGVLNGAYLKTRNNRTFSGFTSIPFAKPPVGNLRFQAPVPNDPWEGERNASGVSPECPQKFLYHRSEIISGDEDCLYLNVYTPKLSNFESNPLPVMIWIHGGGLLCGAGNANWYGPGVLLDRDIVMVATNYRLGPLGFLATGDSVVPGNNGLKDQSLAIKWVKKNIYKFGGNPEKLTLFGESAGGVCTHYHMISPRSRGLFNGAILQSGNSLCAWALGEANETIKNTYKLAKALKCPTESSKDMVKCLRKVDARSFIELDGIFKVWDYDPMIPFKPVVEPASATDPFLPDHPLNIIKSGKSMDIPIMIGITTEDGGLKVSGYKNKNLLDEFAEKFDEIIPVSLLFDRTEKDPKTITKQIKKFYFQNKRIQDSMQDILDLYTDAWFFKCSDDVARLHVKYYKQPVYFYLFGYKGSSSFSKVFNGGDDDYGTVHSDDLQYLFPIDFFSNVPSTESDKRMSKILTTLWTNFARTGNPTLEATDLIENKWEPYTLENEEYFLIDNKHLDMRKHLFKDRAEFWRELFSDPIKECKVDDKDEL